MHQPLSLEYCFAFAGGCAAKLTVQGISCCRSKTLVFFSFCASHMSAFSLVRFCLQGSRTILQLVQVDHFFLSLQRKSVGSYCTLKTNMFG